MDKRDSCGLDNMGDDFSSIIIGVPLMEHIKNPFKPYSQNYRLLERLKLGPTTNSEIIRLMSIFNSTGRISDVRKHLKSVGYDIVAKPIRNGIYVYQIKDNETWNG